jgi:hypothetical protein
MRWLSLLFLAACGQPPQPVSVNWEIRGHIRGLGGESLANAEIRAVRVEVNDDTPGQRQSIVARTRTDAGGNFSLDPGVDDDRTFIVVRHPGYAVSEPAHMLDIAARGRVLNYPLHVRPVAVTVVVRGGKGHVCWQTGSPGQGDRLAVDGEVTVSDMPPGEVRIGFESDTGHWEIRELIAEAGLRVHFEAKPAVVRKGVILDPTKKPVAGAWVHDARWPRRQSRSGKDGRFALAGGAIDNEGYLVALAPGYARGFVDPDPEVRIELERSVAFKGRVTDTEGRPLIGARVLMRSMDDPPWVVATIEQGHFFFDHGRPKGKGSGIFGLEVQAQGYLPHEGDALPIDKPGVIDLGTIELQKLK